MTTAELSSFDTIADLDQIEEVESETIQPINVEPENTSDVEFDADDDEIPDIRPTSKIIGVKASSFEADIFGDSVIEDHGLDSDNESSAESDDGLDNFEEGVKTPEKTAKVAVIPPKPTKLKKVEVLTIEDLFKVRKVSDSISETYKFHVNQTLTNEILALGTEHSTSDRVECLVLPAGHLGIVTKGAAKMGDLKIVAKDGKYFYERCACDEQIIVGKNSSVVFVDGTIEPFAFSTDLDIYMLRQAAVVSSLE